MTRGRLPDPTRVAVLPARNPAAGTVPLPERSAAVLAHPAVRHAAESADRRARACAALDELAAVAQRAATEFAAGHTSAAACDILATGVRLTDAATAVREWLDSD